MTSRVSSYKLGRVVECESHHETRFVYRADQDSAIISFTEQPVRLRYPVEGVLRTHFPDFLVRLKDRVEFVEVKSARDAASPEISARTAILIETLAPGGFGYRIATHEELARQPSLDNVILLRRYWMQPVSDEDAAQVMDAVGNGGATVPSLQASGIPPDALLSLASRNIIQFDLDQPFDEAALFLGSAR
jgi:hypothetical protein